MTLDAAAKTSDQAAAHSVLPAGVRTRILIYLGVLLVLLGFGSPGGGLIGLPMRRKFFDVHAATGSPIAKEALDRVGQLYAVEKIINGLPPDRRRQRRQLQFKADCRGIGHLGRADGAPALAQIRARPGLPLYAGALDRTGALLR